LLRRVIHLLLIADLLVCPLLCSAGSLAAAWCQRALPPQQVAAKTTAAPCSCCCQHSAAPTPVVPAAPTAPEDEPAPAPRGFPVDCICKGAIFDRATGVDDTTRVDSLGVLPPPVIAAPVNHTLGFYSSSFLDGGGGRGVRTLLMSLLC
jgi:hypothetical protein